MRGNSDLSNAVAIVGLVGRFPGAQNLQELWENLCAGKETISFFTEQELLEAGVTPAAVADPNFVRARGVYKRPFGFDARFFGYTPREAELLDPQQRIFLECCWEALETAGYDTTQYAGRVGLFAGAGATQYLFRLLFHPIYHSTSPVNVVSANDKDYLCTRVGYKLNLRGPCVTVQTACSTSLVATVLACQSLLTGQADMALAGGVSVMPDEVGGYRYDEGSLFSPDGHCRSFDASARGTIFSSGAGVFVLKRLADALADNDTIHAVIRGFALTNDAAQRAYFTAAGIEGQAAATQQALAMSGLDPETISYVECHGTGTIVGDPIEIKALTRAYRDFTQKRQYCAIGSVKSNIGHADAAAGAAGLAKTVLALRHRTLPASLHYRAPNPSIQFEQTPFFVNTTLREWSGSSPLRAGVNSFGMGGTNAHVVVEEAPALPPTSASRPRQLLLLSARTPTALGAASERLRSFIQSEPNLNLADLAFTLQVGRRGFEHRRWVVCDGPDSAARQLASTGRTASLTSQQCLNSPAVTFLFPGQGAQQVGMGRELYSTEPAFKSAFDECAELFRPHLGADLREVVYAEAGDAEAEERLRQTFFTQPALFSVEYALARLWEEWGVRPAAMLGHSVGEYVAACLAGVFSLEEAAALVAARARLMQSLPAGSMLGLFIPEGEALPLLDESPGLSLAAVNSSATCVVSGPIEEMAAFAARLDARGIAYRPVHTSHAFHSAMMEPILEEFLKEVSRVGLREPNIPYISNVTGTWVTPGLVTSPDYWVRHLRHTVRFAAGVRQLFESGQTLFLEVGPGKTLSSLVGLESDADIGAQAVASLPPAASTEDGGALGQLLEALGRLWGAGVKPDWRGFYARESRRRIPTPTYPFEREDYGITAQSVYRELARGKEPRPGRRAFDDWFYTINWARTARPRQAQEAAEPGHWLLFLSPAADASRLAERLAARGVKPIKVFAGHAFDARAEDEFTVRPGAEEDYRSLFAALAARRLKPSHVVHAFGLTEGAVESRSETCERTLEDCFYSPLFLIKALAAQRGGDSLTLSFMCREAFDVVGSEVTSPLLATVLGPGRVAAQEFVGFQSRVIDVGAGGASRPALLDDSVLDELFSPAGAGRVVAFRGGHRWAPRMDSISLPEPASGVGPRPGGVYLITGGLSGIGYELARSLAAEASPARLLLTGRTALPERAAWPAYLSEADASDLLAEKLRNVLALEEAGAEVLVFAADASDLEEMRGVVSEGRRRFGRIDGVVHSAGVLGEGIIELKERGAADAVLRPKVKGCLVLDELLADEELDFFILCSSNAALAGDAGQVDYTAANAFLDAFAWSKRGAAKNRPVSINWDRWEETGMAARLARQAGGRARPTPTAPPRAALPFEHPVFSARAREEGGETFVVNISADTHWIAGEHKVMGSPTVVGASHVEHVYRAYALLGGAEAAEISDLIFMQPVVLRDGERREVSYTLSGLGDGGYEFAVWSVARGQREEHARGKIGPLAAPPGGAPGADSIFARCAREREPSLFGEDWPKPPASAPIEVSARWDRFVRIAESDSEAIAELSLSRAELDELNTYRLHPAVLDCAVSYVAGPRPGTADLYLPFAYSRIRISGGFAPRMFSHKRFRTNGGGSKEVLSCDVTLFDEAGRTILEVDDFVLKRVPRAAAPPEKPAARPAPAAAGHTSPPETARIMPDEGVRAFHRVLGASGLPQVVVTLDEPGRHEVRTVKKAEREGAEAEPSSEGRDYSRPDLQTPYVAPGSEVEEAIAKIWQSVLGIEGIGIKDDFIELGGHSLLAIQVSSRMRETFGLEFSVTDFYKNPTVEALSAFILGKLIEHLDDESFDELLENS